MNKRNAATLPEMLAALFVMGICFLALLVPFPPGSILTARTIQDAPVRPGRTASAVSTIQKVPNNPVPDPKLPEADSVAKPGSVVVPSFTITSDVVLEISPTLMPSNRLNSAGGSAMPGGAGANTTGLMSAPGVH